MGTAAAVVVLVSVVKNTAHVVFVTWGGTSHGHQRGRLPFGFRSGTSLRKPSITHPRQGPDVTSRDDVIARHSNGMKRRRSSGEQQFQRELEGELPVVGSPNGGWGRARGIGAWMAECTHQYRGSTIVPP
jgi:hypothetical protein